MKPDLIDETVKLFEDSVIPAAKSQKGFREAYLLSDSKSGNRVSITFWDSEEEAIANEQSGYYQDQVNKFKEYFTAPPVREGYEVSVQA
jgi:heme-degrading monooxygenase HmoA